MFVRTNKHSNQVLAGATKNPVRSRRTGFAKTELVLALGELRGAFGGRISLGLLRAASRAGFGLVARSGSGFGFVTGCRCGLRLIAGRRRGLGLVASGGSRFGLGASGSAIFAFTGVQCHRERNHTEC